MVGVKSQSSLRNWLGLGPSRSELEAIQRDQQFQLMKDLLLAERNAREQQAMLLAKALETVSANSGSFTDWLKMVTPSGDNRVRIMSDEVEATQEKERLSKMRESFAPLRATEQPLLFSQDQIMQDHAILLQDLLAS